MSIVPVDPNDWFETTFRALKSYIESLVDSDIYDVINNFPSTSLLAERLPLDKTIIHFEIDNVSNPVLGFGDNVTDYEYDDVSGTVIPIEAQWHVVNFDFGVWTSDRSGGVTARLRAFQALQDAFVGVQAFQNCFNATGLEIVSFTGGNFTEELINDQRVWRIADLVLVIRVFSSRKPAPVPYVDEVLIVPDYVDVEDTEIDDS